jgi:serine/threonine-protein kinase RsbW
VRDSIIMPGSYVGESLELADLIVDRNRVVNIRWGVSLPVSEEFIVGSMESRPVHDLAANLFSRTVAGFLLVLGAPVLLLTALYLKLRRGTAFHPVEFVRLPAASEPASWRTFRRWSFRLPHDGFRPTGVEHRWLRLLNRVLLDGLPGLVNILRGALHFVGVRPRSAKELACLPSDWRDVVLHSKAGLLTEASVQFGDTPSEDELYSAEACYAVRAGVRHDLRLILRWLGQAVFGAPRLTGRSGGTGPPGAGEDRSPTASKPTTGLAALDITSGFEQLEPIRSFVHRACAEQVRPALDEEEAFRVAVAVQEAVTNVMRHAYHGETDGPIRVESGVDTDHLCIRIRHHGDGFDPDRVETPSLDAPREGGFGMYIMSQYADNIEYSCSDEGTRCVSLTFNLSGGQSRGSSDRESRQRDDCRVAVRED